MYVESPIILIVHNDMCRINVSVKDILNFVSRAYKHCAAVTVFSKLNKYFWDTLIQQVLLCIMRINNSRGDLTSICRAGPVVYVRCTRNRLVT